MENVTFTGQQIVSHIDARHRPEVIADNRHGDNFRHFRCFIAPVFDFLERFPPQVVLRIFSLIKPGDPRVDIPAVVIEFAGRSLGHPAHVGERFPFDALQAHDHVGNLHAGIIDVILHFDVPAG